MMGNCKDCRWWDEARPRVEAYPGFNDSWRVCERLSSEELQRPELLRMDGSEIATAPDFGCVQFKAGCSVCRGVPVTSVVNDLARGAAQYGCAEHPADAKS